MTAQTILPANTLSSGGYQVDNSARFDDGSSDSLTKSLGTPTSTKIGTFSCWVKLANVTTEQTMLGAYADSSNRHHIEFQADHNIEIFGKASNSVNMNLITSAFFRDVSAWYHIVVAFDTTQGTAANRVKLYVNGTQVTSFATETYPGQNTVLQFNTDGSTIAVGRNQGGNYADGYMCEVAFIDGQQLAADQFGEFDEDSGIWKPIKVSGLTFGDEGFYLEFKEAGTSANASGIGADTSGNTGHFTVNNLTAVDQSLDTCTNNFVTINSLDTFYTSSTLSDGNLTLTGGSTHAANTATIGLDKGKWYWETRVNSWQSANNSSVGITSQSPTATNYEYYNVEGNIIGYGYYSGGSVYGAGSTLASSYGSASGTHIIGVALDLVNNKIAWSYDGTFQGSANPVNGANMIAITAPSSLLTGLYFPAWSQKTGNKIHNINFGSPPFAISSTQADDDGHGNFEYDVPAGYFALCSKNLAEYGG